MNITDRTYLVLVGNGLAGGPDRPLYRIPLEACKPEWGWNGRLTLTRVPELKPDTPVSITGFHFVMLKADNTWSVPFFAGTFKRAGNSQEVYHLKGGDTLTLTFDVTFCS